MGHKNSKCCPCTAEEQTLLLPKVAGDRPGQQGNAQPTNSIVQFTSALYYCREEEGNMCVDVVRFGDATNVASFDYKTVEASAKAGVKYAHTAGSEVFLSGETVKTIAIPLINDSNWDATLEFEVVITNVQGALMGNYLNRCRVSMIDDDAFPTNKYKELLESGRVEQINGAGLLFEYVKLLWRVDGIRCHSKITLVLDQLKGLYFFLTLYLQMYLVDVVLAPGGVGHDDGGGHGGDGGDHGGEGGHAEGRLLLAGIQSMGRLLHAVAEGEGEEHGEGEFSLMPEVLLIPRHRRATAVVVGLTYILPFVLLHIIDQVKCYLCVPGAPRKQLQANLLRKFLNYREHVRHRVKHSELTMALVRDSVEVVEMGYMKLLEVIRSVGKLLLALIFILAENRNGAIPLMVYPVLLSIWLGIREKKTIEATEERCAKQDSLIESVNSTLTNVRLISDFHLRHSVLDAFESEIDEYNSQDCRARSVITNNVYMAPWLTTLFIGGYMMYGAYEVETVGGSVSLGTFLATINVFKEVGVEIEEIYHQFTHIQMSFGPLAKISRFMNLPTDLADRLKINRARRAEGKMHREHARNHFSTAPGEFAVDKVRIEISDLTFSYKTAQPLFRGATISFEQGKMYAFVGPPHEGKSTLLKLLGQVLLPEEGCGTIFVPPHLRVLHVAQDCTVLQRSFLDNLLLDNALEKVGGMDRIRRICVRLGFSRSHLSYLDQGAAYAGEGEDGDITAWTAAFSSTDFARLHLGRVLIANPECLVIHKPSIYFDEWEASHVLKLIRAHVDEKGVEMPVGTRSLRRPRTCFFTSATLAGVNEADGVYKVSCNGGVSAIEKRHVDMKLLT